MHVRNSLVATTMFAMFLGVMSTGLAGQQRIATDDRPATEKPASANSLFATPVTLHLTQAPLIRAIDALAERSGVRIYYRVELLDAVKTPVSIRASGMPLGSVLEQILEHTNLQAVVSAPNTIAIQRRTIEPILATQQGIIVGKIISSRTKQPLVGATIQVGESQQRVSALEDGTFRLTVAAGEHTIRVRVVGYARVTRRVNVPEGQSIALDIVLNPTASVLDEVIVTSTVIATQRKEIPTPITVIRGEELERRGITRLEQLFRGEVPGVTVLERGTLAYSSQAEGLGVTSQIYSRGSADLSGGANPLKIYVDGVELLDPAYIGTLDPRSIEKIEIVTGPQAATIYGSGAMGGVMQIFTKTGSGAAFPEITVSLKYGALQNSFSDGMTPQHNDGLTARGGLGPAFSYSGTVSYDYTGQWQPLLFNRRWGASVGATHKSGPLTITATFSNTGSTNGTWAPSFHPTFGTLDLVRKGIIVIEGSNPAATMMSQQVSTASSQMVSLNMDYAVTPLWQHHATIGKTQLTAALKPQAPNFSFVNSPIGGDTLYQVRRTNGQRLTWSYNTSYVSSLRWMSSTASVGTNGSLADQLSVNGCQATAVSATIVGCSTGQSSNVTLPLKDQNWGAFARWQVGFFRQLYTTFALRMEQNPRYGRDVKFDFTPTNGLTYTLEFGDISLKLMGSYGRSTRPPAPDQRLGLLFSGSGFDSSVYYMRFANPDLRPEYSRGPQGGFELYIGNRGSLTINHYDQEITDLLQNVRVDSFLRTHLESGSGLMIRQTQWQNVANVRQYGWDGTGSLNLGPVALRGTYSWSDARVIYGNPSAVSLYRPGDSFRNIPTHTGSLNLTYARGPVSATLVSNYTGPRTWGSEENLRYHEIVYARLGMYSARRKSGSADMRGYPMQPATVKSNLSGLYRVSSQLSLALNMVNAGNNVDSDVGNLNPTLGRQTTVGVSYRFARR